MMKTVSKDLAVQLKEAGFPQSKSEFYWVESNHKDKFIVVYSAGLAPHIRLFAAPTAEEIFERLPECIELNNTLWAITIEKYFDKWHIRYGQSEDCMDEMLAEAAGKMWLYLKKENQLIEK